MVARLTVKMDNAAFEGDNAGNELARILRELADCVEEQTAAGIRGREGVCDINGNMVGELVVK